MTLDHYLNSPNAKTLTALALEIGVSKSRLSQLRKLTAWPPELALQVEKATEGKLSASFLSDVVAKARAA